MDTITAKARLGLVTLHGVDFQIVDIGLRMLTPRELIRAQFGRFADEYILIGNQEEQVAAIGNSVPPEMSELLVKLNVTIRRVTDAIPPPAQKSRKTTRKTRATPV